MEREGKIEREGERKRERGGRQRERDREKETMMKWSTGEKQITQIFTIQTRQIHSNDICTYSKGIEYLVRD